METLPSYALTTVQRIKDRLSIKDTQFDTLLARYILQVSDFMRARCDQNFLQQTYTNEEYNVQGNDFLLLNQAPVFSLNVTGNTTAGSTSMTGVNSTAGIIAGMPIVGEGIPTGTTVASKTSDTIVMSQAATATATGSSAKVSGLIRIQYRAGLPSTPTWTSYTVDQYELTEDGKTAIVRLYGNIGNGGSQSNTLRATYIAGYLIDWENVGTATHTLPGDLTLCAENLVVRAFKRREVAGKTNEGLAGASVAWNKDIDPDDQATIDQYTRLPRFF